MGLFDFLRSKKKPAARRTGGKGLATRRYRAPSLPNTSGGWFPSGGLERAPSALPQIRARARDLADNTPYGAAAVRALTGHTVGFGLRLGIAGDDAYRAALSAWASSTDCDYAGQQSLYSLQVTAAETMCAAGDCLLVVRQKRRNGGLQTQIQLIDPEHIDESAAPKYKGN